MVAALGLKAPPPVVRAVSLAPGAPAVAGTARDITTGEMLRNPIFWLMFVMMTLMSTTGLMVTSQIATFANDFGIAKLVVLGVPAMILTLNVDRACNGLTRPFFGWVSDRIGRENTMFVAFGLEGIAMAIWLATISHPVAFVLMSGVVFFGWGEIFSLFPSTLTDTFGARFATKNYGCLYIAQGIGAIFGGPLASLLHVSAGKLDAGVLAGDRVRPDHRGAGAGVAEADAAAVPGSLIGSQVRGSMRARTPSCQR